MTSRFQEPNTRLAPRFATYKLDGGFYLRKACAYDRFVSAQDDEDAYVSRMEFDLAHDQDGDAEILAVRLDDAAHEFLPLKSPALEELARQYLRDDKAHWERACDYLDEYGDLIECERDAA